MEKEAVKLAGEVKIERAKSVSLAKENEEMKALAGKYEVRTNALHWWLTAAVIAGVFALLSGMGLGSSVRRESRLAKCVSGKGGGCESEEESW